MIVTFVYRDVTSFVTTPDGASIFGQRTVVLPTQPAANGGAGPANSTGGRRPATATGSMSSGTDAEGRRPSSVTGPLTFGTSNGRPQPTFATGSLSSGTGTGGRRPSAATGSQSSGIGSGGRQPGIATGSISSGIGTGGRRPAGATGAMCSGTGTRDQQSVSQIGNQNIVQNTGVLRPSHGNGLQINGTNASAQSLTVDDSNEDEYVDTVSVMLVSQEEYEQLAAGEQDSEVVIPDMIVGDHTQDGTVFGNLFPRPNVRTQPSATVTSGALEALEEAAAEPSVATPASARPRATPSSRGSRRQRGTRTQPPAAATGMSAAAVHWFNNQRRCNKLLARAKLLKYQSDIALNIQREELLALQRLEVLTRLKNLDPNIPVAEDGPQMNLTSDLYTKDPSEVLPSSSDDEFVDGDPDVNHRKVSIIFGILCITLLHFTF